MDVEFDPAKDAADRLKHGLTLSDASAFDFDTAIIVVDGRSDYGEVRCRAFARMEGRGYCLVFTLKGETLRPISFRRAHDKEIKRYGR